MPSGVLVQDASENCIVTGYESEIETRTTYGDSSSLDSPVHTKFAQ